MVALSLVSLCVFIFGAYAYAATTVLALRDVPVWGRTNLEQGRKAALDPVVITLCGICTVWFVLHALAEFQLLIGRPRWQGWPELVAATLSYSFPPLIMHNVLHDRSSICCDGQRQHRLWAMPVYAMYVLSAATAAFILGAATGLLPEPRSLSALSGFSMGALFTLCSIYCIALISQRGATGDLETSDSAKQRGLRRAMIGLFLIMIPLFFVLMLPQDRRLVAAALDRFARTLPIFFLVASIYFENRFEFYDLIVKRAATLVASLLVTGVFFAVTLGALDKLPRTVARPWLFAVALLPIAMVLPHLHRALGRFLDRMWFGREFTPVEAVKHVLSAMHPATDERALADATEARLSEMFHTDVRILLDDEPVPRGAVVETLATPSNALSGSPLRVAVVRRPGSRVLLSEDVSLLRSLVAVFGYMLENVRLQRGRQEQDQIAHELRL